MNGILGKIVLGQWELGTVNGGVPTITLIFQADGPTLTLTTSGGSVSQTYTAVLGTIPFGSFELGKPRNVNSAAILGKGTFMVTASPLAAFIGSTIPTGVFVATAEPTLLIVTGAIFNATGDPRMSISLVAPPGFVATALPQLKIFVLDYQQQTCLVSGPLARSTKPINYVY